MDYHNNQLHKDFFNWNFFIHNSLNPSKWYKILVYVLSGSYKERRILNHYSSALVIPPYWA